jgi:hypothetical protein
VPYRSTPPEQSARASAGRKRKAAERHRALADRLEAEADALDLIWFRFEAARLGKKQTA